MVIEKYIQEKYGQKQATHKLEIFHYITADILEGS